jgi:hypothetical protein
MELSEVLSKIVSQNIRTALHYAVVTGIENDSGIYYLTIELAGSTTPINKVRYLRGYVPRIGDTVVVQVNKSDIFVIDSLAEAGRSLNPVAYRTTTFSVNRDTLTTIPMEAVENDPWGCWSAGSATRLTAPIAGRYVSTASMLLQAANANMQLSIWLNDTLELARQDVTLNKTVVGAFHGMVTTVPITLAEGEYIQMRVEHDFNPSLNLVLSADSKDHTGYFNAFSLQYLGP